jgi:hypothetical protein
MTDKKERIGNYGLSLASCSLCLLFVSLGLTLLLYDGSPDFWGSLLGEALLGSFLTGLSLYIVGLIITLSVLD